MTIVTVGSSLFYLFGSIASFVALEAGILERAETAIAWISVEYTCELVVCLLLPTMLSK